MASARIHEVIALKINEDYHFDELLLRIGTVAPDCWRNVETINKSKYLTHFWNFEIKEGQANDYEKFYQKYKEEINNPFYFGYLIHLIVDQYWKTYIDPRYEVFKDGEKLFILKDGSLHDDKDHFGYHESLKIQKQLVKKYNLSLFPTNKEDIPDFFCNIEELDLTGLFGPNGTLNYINQKIYPTDNDEPSVVFDMNDINDYIDETVEYVKKELKRIKEINNEKSKTN